MGVLVFVFLLVLLAGVPAFIALAGSSLLYTHFIAGIPDFVILHRMAGGIDSFPLLAVPFFILAGNLMNSAGITNRIYDFAVALAGWTRGGLAHVNIIGSVIFAGMSGTAIADAAGLGTIEIKAMKEHGYSTEFAVGVTAASATLGPIIPPSLPFVIYGMMANVSVGALFLAGILPGALMAILMMLTVAYFAHKNNRGGGVDLRLDAHRHRRYCRHRELGAGLHQGSLGVPALGQPPDAVRRLLSRADRRHHDPGADPAADRDPARCRSDPLRLGDGAQ